jgi:hypothetical protein
MDGQAKKELEKTYRKANKESGKKRRTDKQIKTDGQVKKDNRQTDIQRK